MHPNPEIFQYNITTYRFPEEACEAGRHLVRGAPRAQSAASVHQVLARGCAGLGS